MKQTDMFTGDMLTAAIAREYERELQRKALASHPELQTCRYAGFQERAEPLVLTNESVAALLAVANAYISAGRALPDHVRADISDAAACDEIAFVLRNQCQRLLARGDAA